MPVADLPPVTGSAEVVGTVVMTDGELVVRIKPTQYRDVTGRRLSPDPDLAVAPHPLARSCLRYVGPLTPEQTARFLAEVTAWDARSWWRRWGTDVADWCWRRWRR